MPGVVKHCCKYDLFVIENSHKSSHYHCHYHYYCYWYFYYFYIYCNVRM